MSCTTLPCLKFLKLNLSKTVIIIIIIKKSNKYFRCCSASPSELSKDKGTDQGKENRPRKRLQLPQPSHQKRILQWLVNTVLRESFFSVNWERIMLVFMVKNFCFQITQLTIVLGKQNRIILIQKFWICSGQTFLVQLNNIVLLYTYFCNDFIPRIE